MSINKEVAKSWSKERIHAELSDLQREITSTEYYIDTAVNEFGKVGLIKSISEMNSDISFLKSLL